MPTASSSIADRGRAATADADTTFLHGLGLRCRELREQRGMARKLVAKTAEVSERYLAQLEAGDGNVSILLLRRIAHALGVSLSELLGSDDEPHALARGLVSKLLEQAPAHRLEDLVFRLIRDLSLEQAARRRRIALIGLRGAGKSTLGRLLAQALGIEFVELDQQIEQEAGMSLNEVFMLYGQSGYRRIERKCLEQILRSEERRVISVGGGIVSETDTYDLLLTHCYTVWMQASPEEHMSRVIAQGDLRPMAGKKEAMEDLRRILQTREPLYRKADASVSNSGRSIEQTLTTLLELAPLREMLTEKEAIN